MLRLPPLPLSAFQIHSVSIFGILQQPNLKFQTFLFQVFVTIFCQVLKWSTGRVSVLFFAYHNVENQTRFLPLEKISRFFLLLSLSNPQTSGISIKNRGHCHVPSIRYPSGEYSSIEKPVLSVSGDLFSNKACNWTYCYG